MTEDVVLIAKGDLFWYKVVLTPGINNNCLPDSPFRNMC